MEMRICFSFKTSASRYKKKYYRNGDRTQKTFGFPTVIGGVPDSGFEIVKIGL